jgi:hypothetical protein
VTTKPRSDVPWLHYTVAAGRAPEVHSIMHGNADDDMWFAYNTVLHPARLVLP